MRSEGREAERAAAEARAAAKDDARFLRAVRVPAEEYVGAVYSRGLPGGGAEGEGYYPDVATMKRQREVMGVDPPAYVWACREVTPSTDASQVIDDALQEHHESARDAISNEQIVELQGFLDGWWKRTGTFSWFPDYGRAVVIDPSRLPSSVADVEPEGAAGIDGDPDGGSRDDDYDGR